MRRMFNFDVLACPRCGVMATRRAPWNRCFILSALAFAAAVHLISSIPNAVAVFRSNDDFIFAGPLRWENDQNLYASFVRQAADGHILHRNVVTYIEHRAVYFNSEWLAVGWVMAAVNGSQTWTREIWRAVATLAFVLGFAVLARQVLELPGDRYLALGLVTVGGGFGWVFIVAHRLGWSIPSTWATMDLTTGTHPFVQMALNPHFALPHGLFLFAIAAYLEGEHSGQSVWSWVAGFIAALGATMRPYDMLTLLALVPLFIVVDRLWTRDAHWLRLWPRVVPLLVVAPVLLYQIWVFYVHPVFRHWASQGRMQPIPWSWHALGLGIAGVLCVWRLVWVRRLPLTRPDRLLLAWVISTALLMHAHELPLSDLLPYAPQIGNTLMPPVILLGLPALTRLLRSVRRLSAARAIRVAVVSVNALSSVLLVIILVREVSSSRRHFLPAAELASYAWLDRHARGSDVVLCLPEAGNRLTRFASARVVAGHWSVTPDYERTRERLLQFFDGSMGREASIAFARDLGGVDWIYAVEAGEDLAESTQVMPSKGRQDFSMLQGIRLRFANRHATIWSIDTDSAMGRRSNSTSR